MPSLQYNREKRVVGGGRRVVKKGFTTLRQECLAANTLYQDPEFPPNDYSINFKGVTRRTYEWKRPHELVKDPGFFIDGATRFDIQQGELGDCWLLAAVANLTQHPKLFHVVVPRDQGFKQLYAGIFHFRFWQYGRWQEVVVDDMLPTYHGQLVFMHSKTKNEFWCALLEKAYAKMYGGYEALKGGNINESMVDMTGGVVEMIDLRSPPPNLFNILFKANLRGSLIGCAIEPERQGMRGQTVLSNGLIERHAYSMTRVTAVDIGSAIPRLQEQKNITPFTKPHLQDAFDDIVKSMGSVMSSLGLTRGHGGGGGGGRSSSSSSSSSKPPGMTNIPRTLAPLTNWNLGMAFPEGKADLIRLHNPWGNETEWLGSWSDKSPEWNTIAPEDRERLRLTFDDDGEFWMSYQDFIKNFTTVEICDVTPEVYSSEEDDENGNSAQQSLSHNWKIVMYEGAWVSRHSAGGCRNFIDTFASNPQYILNLVEADRDGSDECTVVISLMQKNVRQLKRYGADYVPIGFTIYKYPKDRQPGQKLDTEFFRYNASFAKVPFFLNTREVTTRFQFPPGIYVIIPSTFESEMTGEYLLRIFTEAK
ncbi:hypothetical protein Pcinc_040074 [Petrolisthes cinctipes]|uniref:Calpain catalytic domain-containing protein n=1 Tax=Petrolisthes cinctipes TaxID=88211 RepID=A0AAE1BMA8_PETCI|nr:hypothetical protein Pcinc_040074 [Petrolisthes cinctipes]